MALPAAPCLGSGRVAQINPFRIAVPDADLDDLKDRLGRTRWPEAECVDDWSQGIPLGYTRELADYWANEYDWRAREAALNRFDQFTTEIDGLDIHFIHQRSPHDDALPLVITHGWPGSVVEFHKVIEPLTIRRHAGTPFTWCARRCRDTGSPASRPAPAGASRRSPTAWETLMGRLGYERYGAQGGDWGAAVTTQIGRNGGRCAAIHLNMPLAPADRQPGRTRPRRSKRALEPRRLLPEVGHRLLQAAVDPAADPRLRAGRLARRAAGVDRREVLVVDGLRRSSRERAHPRRAARQRDAVLGHRVSGVVGAAVLGELPDLRRRRAARVELPTGVAAFPKEILRAPRSWCEAAYNITHLDEDAARRALRGVRAARAVRRRRARLLRYRALGERRSRPTTSWSVRARWGWRSPTRWSASPTPPSWWWIATTSPAATGRPPIRSCGCISRRRTTA